MEKLNDCCSLVTGLCFLYECSIFVKNNVYLEGLICTCLGHDPRAMSLFLLLMKVISCKSLCRANLKGADLSHADLRGADLDGANLFKAIFDGANSSGVNLRDEQV